jgi:hypothetical protein
MENCIRCIASKGSLAAVLAPSKVPPQQTIHLSSKESKSLIGRGRDSSFELPYRDPCNYQN